VRRRLSEADAKIYDTLYRTHQRGTDTSNALTEQTPSVSIRTAAGANQPSATSFQPGDSKHARRKSQVSWPTPSSLRAAAAVWGKDTGRSSLQIQDYREIHDVSFCNNNE